MIITYIIGYILIGAILSIGLVPYTLYCTMHYYSEPFEETTIMARILALLCYELLILIAWPVFVFMMLRFVVDMFWDIFGKDEK